MLTHIDLCSGIGGFALAARWLGMQTIGFCEIDPFCQRVLAKNFPGVPIHDDLTTLDAGAVRGWMDALGADSNAECERWRERGNASPNRDTEETSVPRPTLITGGYPCQPFSLAGKRLGAEDDRHLWPYIAALVADLRPRYCLFENVAGHITLGLDRVLADLEALGYTCRPVVVPACALNAPHRRDRVWLMAHANDQRINRSGPRGAGRNEFADQGEPLAHAETRGVRRGSAPGQSGFAALRGEVVADADRGGRDGRSHIEGQGSTERGGTGAGSEALADTPHDRSEHGVLGQGVRAESSGSGSIDVSADSDRAGLEEQRRGLADGEEHAAVELGGGREAQPGLGVQDDGLSGRVDGRLARPWDTDWEAGVPRVSDGCTDRVSKLKALGNAIVPQVAYVLMGSMIEEGGYE